MKALGIVGTLRRDSWNRKLWAVARRVLEQQGVEVEEFNLAPVPFYNADVHAQGFPPVVVALRDAIQRAHALVIATPEYNNSIPGVLKNALEWASRAPNVCSGKVALIVGATTAQQGLANMHMHLSYVLQAIDVWVVPQPRVLLVGVEKQFTPQGEMADPAAADLLAKGLARLLDAARRMQVKG